MSRYCGVCGASLGMTSLTTGRCEQCNARVEPSSLPDDERNLAAAEAPTLTGRELESAADPAHTYTSSLALPAPGREITPIAQPVTPPTAVEAQRRSRRESPRVPLLWVLSLLLVVALLLASASVVLLARSGNVPIVISPFTSSNANANSSSNSSSGIPGAGTTATSGGTGQGQGGQGGTGGSGTGTSTLPAGGTSTQPASSTATSSQSGAPTPSVGVAPTSTATPSVLSVSPPSFSATLCLASVQFNIGNSGQAPMKWSASGSVQGYTISPASGTVDGGDNVTVKVTDLLGIGLVGSGTVTITASGAVNSPQQFTISCTL
jgi:hypothetical protein